MTEERGVWKRAGGSGPGGGRKTRRGGAWGGGRGRGVAVRCGGRKDVAYGAAALREAGSRTGIVGVGGRLDQPAGQGVGAGARAAGWLGR